MAGCGQEERLEVEKRTMAIMPWIKLSGEQQSGESYLLKSIRWIARFDSNNSSSFSILFSEYIVFSQRNYYYEHNVVYLVKNLRIHRWPSWIWAKLRLNYSEICLFFRSELIMKTRFKLGSNFELKGCLSWVQILMNERFLSLGIWLSNPGAYRLPFKRFE